MSSPSPFKSAFLNSTETSLHVVKKDGKTLTEPMSHNDCFKWLHDHVSSSVDWAIKYEGYLIDPAKAGDGPNLPDLSSPEDQAFMKDVGIAGSSKRRDYGSEPDVEPKALPTDEWVPKVGEKIIVLERDLGIYMEAVVVEGLHYFKPWGFCVTVKNEQYPRGRKVFQEDVMLIPSQYRESYYIGNPDVEPRTGRSNDSRIQKPASAIAKQAAAVSAAPRDYPVQRKEDGFWYIVGLQGEELGEAADGPPTVKTSDSWLNVHHDAKNLDLAEQLYRELYAEFQTNDNLKDGDTFSTPIGKFMCQGVDVIPADDDAKRAIAEVDESYRCQCGCDQVNHRKGYDDNGFKMYGQCSDHPECTGYVKR